MLSVCVYVEFFFSCRMLKTSYFVKWIWFLCLVCSWDNFLWKINFDRIFKMAKLHQMRKSIELMKKDFNLISFWKNKYKIWWKTYLMAFYISFPALWCFVLYVQTLFDLYFLILCTRKFIEFIYCIECTFCVSGFEDLKECTVDECTLLINWNKKKTINFLWKIYIFHWISISACGNLKL